MSLMPGHWTAWAFYIAFSLYRVRARNAAWSRQPGCTQQQTDFLCADRPAEKVALNFIAAVFTQEGLLYFGFDTFGNDLEVQFVPQRNHCSGDGFVVLVVGRSRTKDWSILSLAIGKLFNAARLE